MNNKDDNAIQQSEMQQQNIKDNISRTDTTMEEVLIIKSDPTKI